MSACSVLQGGVVVRLMEWTGTAWTVVCPVDDVPMTEYNGAAELSCGTCGRSYIEIIKEARR